MSAPLPRGGFRPTGRWPVPPPASVVRSSAVIPGHAVFHQLGSSFRLLVCTSDLLSYLVWLILIKHMQPEAYHRVHAVMHSHISLALVAKLKCAPVAVNLIEESLM